MNGLATALLGFFPFGVMLLMFPFMGILLGAFIGWVVSMTFLASWVTSGLQLLGIATVSGSQLYQVGAALGFVGGFFKSNNSNTNTNN